jgi:uncharacterized protein (TIGR02145 family)
MKKPINFPLVTLGVLLSLIMVFNACKKKDDNLSSEAKPAVPTVTPDPATAITPTWATLNGVVNANKLMTNVSFEYGTSTDYSANIIATPDTMSGIIKILVIANLTGLNPGTLYHYRVKSVKSLGTSYGRDTTFTTVNKWVSNIVFNPDLNYGSVEDVDGNTYKTIVIGSQTWMAENLSTTKFNDNTSIPLITGSGPWTALSTPAFCIFNNDSLGYGCIYNWFAVNTGKLCPTGWHIPSDDEWTTLTTFLGGEDVAGTMLRETGTKHWLTSNTEASNSSGFTALPGGYCGYDGIFGNLHRNGDFWSATEFSSIESYYRDIYYGFVNVTRTSSSKLSGFSVRCLKD